MMNANTMGEVTYIPGQYPGWDNYRFEFDGATFELLTINREDETSSLLWLYNRHAFIPFFPDAHNIGFDCVITPEAAYTILLEIRTIYHLGFGRGDASARADIRKALGL